MVIIPIKVAAHIAGIGSVADNMLEPISILTDFVTTAALLIGAMFFFVAFVKYMQHRKNPLAVPINNVVFLVIFGILLIILPLSYKLTDATEPPTHYDYNKK